MLVQQAVEKGIWGAKFIEENIRRVVRYWSACLWRGNFLDLMEILDKKLCLSERCQNWGEGLEKSIFYYKNYDA